MPVLMILQYSSKSILPSALSSANEIRRLMSSSVASGLPALIAAVSSVSSMLPDLSSSISSNALRRASSVSSCGSSTFGPRARHTEAAPS